MHKSITEYTLSDLLPHRPPMILISRVVSVSENFETLIAEVDINEETMFYDEELNGVPPLVALEYMAQSFGCLSGYTDLCQNEVPRMGFILGSRKLKNNISKFENGKTYQIEVKIAYFDNTFGSVDCSIGCGEEKDLITASLNAFRVEDMQEFLKNKEQGLSHE